MIFLHVSATLDARIADDTETRDGLIICGTLTCLVLPTTRLTGIGARPIVKADPVIIITLRINGVRGVSSYRRVRL